MTGGALYGLGVFLASFTGGNLTWLYFSYGLIGGIGLGFGYIVPIAVLVKWFPDKRGLITGIAVGGFGVGALVTAPLANYLIHTVGVFPTFAYLGAVYLLVTVVAGWFMQHPARRLCPRGLDSARQRPARRCRRRFHSRPSPLHLAVVGTLASPLP